jgi:hypothetical protein
METYQKSIIILLAAGALLTYLALAYVSFLRVQTDTTDTIIDHAVRSCEHPNCSGQPAPVTLEEYNDMVSLDRVASSGQMSWLALISLVTSWLSLAVSVAVLLVITLRNRN